MDRNLSVVEGGKLTRATEGRIEKWMSQEATLSPYSEKKEDSHLSHIALSEEKNRTTVVLVIIVHGHVSIESLDAVIHLGLDVAILLVEEKVNVILS